MQENNNEKTVCLLIHRLTKGKMTKKGGADYILSYLIDRGYRACTVEHPLRGAGATRVTSYFGQTRSISLFGRGLIRWLQEVIANAYFVRQFHPGLIIAVDPLNFFAAYFCAALFGFKSTEIVFHSIDFSDVRFKNTLLNRIYLYLYKFSLKKADKVTFVSLRMVSKIRTFTGSFEKDRMFFLPNSPEFDKLVRTDPGAKSANTMVYSKSFIGDAEIDLLIKIAELVVRQIPAIEFIIIGEVSTQTREKIEKSPFAHIFKLHGVLDYGDNISIIASSYIGFAWYDGMAGFEKYADSLKIREYACAGLPCISNGYISTSEEMAAEGAGVIVENAKEAAEAIVKLILDKVKYANMRERAINWAKRMDKKIMLNRLFGTRKVD